MTSQRRTERRADRETRTGTDVYMAIRSVLQIIDFIQICRDTYLVIITTKMCVFILLKGFTVCFGGYLIAGRIMFICNICSTKCDFLYRRRDVVGTQTYSLSPQRPSRPARVGLGHNNTLIMVNHRRVRYLESTSYPVLSCH